MKRVLFCLLLVLPAAGCASSQHPPDSPQAFCQRQANNDPEVTKLENQVMVEGGPGPYQRQKIELLKYRALQRCLLARGAAPKGGVEPVMRQ